MTPVGDPRARSEHHAAWVLHHLLGQLHLVAYGVTPVATSWNFRAA